MTRRMDVKSSDEDAMVGKKYDKIIAPRKGKSIRMINGLSASF